MKAVEQYPPVKIPATMKCECGKCNGRASVSPNTMARIDRWNEYVDEFMGSGEIDQEVPKSQHYENGGLLSVIPSIGPPTASAYILYLCDKLNTTRRSRECQPLRMTEHIGHYRLLKIEMEETV